MEWIALSFSKESSRPRDWTQVSHIVGRFFTVWAIREVCFYCWVVIDFLDIPYSIYPFSCWHIFRLFSLWGYYIQSWYEHSCKVSERTSDFSINHVFLMFCHLVILEWLPLGSSAHFICKLINPEHFLPIASFLVLSHSEPLSTCPNYPRARY